MGAQQSSSRGDGSDAATPTTAPKTCYYDLLEVDRHATDDEIKRAYRKKALELHPDRNYGDVENATRKFAEVQSAYEVLSDPQERAWYDSHRDAILSGQDAGDPDAEPTTFRNVRLTSTEEIMSLMRKFNSTIPFNDEPTGFFGISRETFEHLALEEEAAAEFKRVDVPEYPTFGSSDDNYDSVVKPFYTAWAGFSTRKSFSWKDKYRLSDAPDRRVRRLMEKENKRIRDDAIREFNDAVRFLVTFVRKRDPRYLPNTQTEAERQASLRNAAAAQAARSRAANQEKLALYEVPEWARSRSDDSQAEDQFSESEEESEVEILECVVCNKNFKSEKQLETHERSKKHIKAVQQLHRQMRQEGAELDLDEVHTTSSVAKVDGGDKHADHNESDNLGSAVEVTGEANNSDTELDGRQEPPGIAAHQGSSDARESSEGSENEDYAPRNVVESRLTSNNTKTTIGLQETGDELFAATESLSVNESRQEKKIGKAKAKREKKAAARAQEEVHRCSVCGDTFTSKTKLFNHIREEGHAAAIPKQTINKKKRR